MKKYIIPFILGYFIIYGCSSSSNTSTYTENATPVTVEKIGVRTIETKQVTTGSVKAQKEIEVKTETSGAYYLKKNPRTGFPFQLGDKVLSGETIIEIKNQEFVNNTQIESKELQVDIALKEYEGQKLLYDKGGATQKDVNNARNSYINAISALDNAKISLAKLNIKAPFDGTIVALPQYSNGIEVTNGASMVKIMDYSKMYMEAQFPENNINKIITGQHVYVTHYSLKKDTLSGTIEQLSPAINEETRTFTGIIRIDNPKLLLRPGMFAKAEIVTERKDAVIAIPMELLNGKQKRSYVYVVNNNNAEMRVVTTGINDNKYVEITDGVKEGDRLIVKGYEWLRNNSKIKITE